MKSTDKQNFNKLLIATLGVYDKIPAPEVTSIWWNALAAHEFEEIKTAFAEHIKRGKFAPRPADILELLDLIAPDGRLSADEAWALAPRDEMVSVVLTEEIMEAWGIAQPLLDEGDQVAARMAFKDAYSRLVDTNRRNGIKVKWRASLGWNKEGRAPVLAEAVRLGRLGAEHALGLLPPHEAQMMLDMAGAQPLAIGRKPVSEAQALENLDKIRAMLDGSRLGKVTA